MPSAVLTFANIYFSAPTVTSLSANTPTKAAGATTTMATLSGFTHTVDNRLVYVGTTTRVFEIAFAGSVTKGGGGITHSHYAIYKNGSIVTGSTVGRALAKASDEGAFAVSCAVPMATGDYVELWLSTDTGDNLTIEGGVLSAKVLG